MNHEIYPLTMKNLKIFQRLKIWKLITFNSWNMELIEITESKIVYIDKFKLAKSYLIFYKIFN